MHKRLSVDFSAWLTPTFGWSCCGHLWMSSEFIFSGHPKIAGTLLFLIWAVVFSSLCQSSVRDTFQLWIHHDFHSTSPWSNDVQTFNTMLLLLKVWTPLPIAPYGTISISGTLRLSGWQLHDPASTSIPTATYLPIPSENPNASRNTWGGWHHNETQIPKWHSHRKERTPPHCTVNAPARMECCSVKLGDSIGLCNAPCLDRRRTLDGQNVFFAGGRSPDLDFTLLNAQSALGLGADLASWLID